MNEILNKYNALSPAKQKELDDYLDILLSKDKGKNPFDLSSWKKKAKEVSVWSEEDIKGLEESIHQFKQWQPEKW